MLRLLYDQSRLYAVRALAVVPCTTKTFSGNRGFWADAPRDGDADGAERVGGGLLHVVARQRRQHQAPSKNRAETGDQGRPDRVVEVLHVKTIAEV